ncbi:MAG: radical SAM protein [Selenomonadaceae bacterium]|nr:radical SAM protein [Selenomonadaceae bacterium]
MKIFPGVTWHPYAEKVYVHSVDSQHDYIFEGIALDVLNFFAEHDDASFENLCEKLSAEYAIDDAEEFQNDMREFVGQLLDEKILYEGANPYTEEPWSNKIPMEVANIFAREHKLFSMTFELTYRCVEKCIHCYIDDAPKFCAKDELTLDEYKNILRQAREMGCVQILFTGGEVLLRPDLCDIVEEAVKLGFIVDVYTTGVGLTEKVFDRLCAAQVNGISVSLYSGIASEHDKITGVKGSFDKTLKALLMFKAAGVNTFIKCVAMKQNLDSLESLYELGKRLNFYVGVSPRIISGRNGKCAADYALGDVELYKKFYEMQSRYVPADTTDEKISREQILNGRVCGAGLSSMSVDPFGGVRPCLSFTEAFGSVREDTLENLWERVRDLKYLRNRLMRKVTPQCETCEYLQHCQVCVAELILDRGENFCDCGETLTRAKAAAEAKL